MLQPRFALLLVFIYILILQLHIIECRPHSQRIIIRGHEWIVPDEPGWEDLVHKVDSIRHRLLSDCATLRDCRIAAEQLRQVFLNHPVSGNTQDEAGEDLDLNNDDFSIFKWG